ncbi:type II secretion system minor pseudopilin [Candidatus Nitrotoga sp. M5]|uniref:general secretion pathway protein GspK n=1 Tax=Candidatus Nitrotoga sp. M5 TaxID=2890409 RepID=UPI001EF2C5EA|nr:type II secretion system protein GspK [Candidatus Nitrotoga sp. M5]CAH1386509.1 Type II secretion system protein K [Candidatus Nitrotoga sp. M5]
MKTVTTKKHQHGIALVLVLWATTLLAVIAASFAFSMRTDMLLAQNLAASARAQAVADAGIQRAVYEIFKSIDDLQRWKGDGVPHLWTFGGAKLSITLLDVSGKIDINSASDELLKSLLKSVGLNEEESNILLDAIKDWRDGDDLPHPKGAEVSEYQAAGLKYRPANAPFETVNELQRVLGMTPELFANLADTLTVDSHQAGINAVIAPRNVLLALPGATVELVDAYLAERQEALLKNLPPPPFAPAAAAVAGEDGSVYSVRAEAALPDGTVFVRETVVKIDQGAVRKVIYFSWKEGEASPKQIGEGQATIN